MASHTSGDEALIRLVSTVRPARSPPNAILASSTLSAARSPAVTDPISALSLKRRWLYTMSRCRLLTGTSTGSHTVPPEWCRCGDMYVSFTKFWKSVSVAYLRPESRSCANGEP